MGQDHKKTKDPPLEALREEARDCRACPLWEPATQTVFGEGSARARLMLVGEQPGDQEDLAGHPFVGPAGRVLDRALADAAIDRGTVYVTNAVKHFKFVMRGKRRMHQKPNMLEVRACHPWLESELAAVRPAVVVALGATAAQSLLGRPTPVGSNRGRAIPLGETTLFITIHPSFLLRMPDEDRDLAYDAFVADLVRARDFAQKK